jgi:hypothetical protein
MRVTVIVSDQINEMIIYQDILIYNHLYATIPINHIEEYTYGQKSSHTLYRKQLPKHHS